MDWPPNSADLHHQGIEVLALVRCCPHLQERTAVDVGAERGELAAALRRGGYERLWAYEAHPENAAELRGAFSEDDAVTVGEIAVSETDGEAMLHLARANGAPTTLFHSLETFTETTDVSWHDQIAVPRRSLGSLARSGELPGRVGLVKIDTEGHDLAVVRGMGDLEADVIMVEHWVDLPKSVGRCPWDLGEILAELRPRGFADFAFIAHRPGADLVQWNDGSAETGDWGNLIFIHERVVDRLRPIFQQAANEAQFALETALRVERDAAQERLTALKQLDEEHRSLADEADRLRKV